MDQKSFEESLRGFQSFDQPTPQKKEGSSGTGLFGGLKSFIGGSQRDGTLPFAYADPSHTRTVPIGPEVSSRGWLNLPTWMTMNPLSSPTLANPPESWFESFGLTRSQRYIAFASTVLLSLFLFFLALLRLPFLIISPKKFFIPYVAATLFLFISFGFIHGFISYFKHLTTPSKIPFSAGFVLSTLAALYSAISLQSYILTVVTAMIQIGCMISFIVSYVPGGSAGITMMTGLIGSSIRSRISPSSF